MIRRTDSIFDLIAEADGTLYYPADYHFVSDFNTDQFKTYPNVVVGARNACDKVYVVTQIAIAT